MIRPLCVLLLLLVGLTGCSAVATKDAEDSASAWAGKPFARLAEPPPTEEILAGVEEPPPLPRRRPKNVATQTAAMVAEEEEPDIDGLVGLGFDATKALLGTPALDEVQAPARVWAYNGRGCVLSIFFYPHVDGSTFRALTYEVKGVEDSSDVTDRCYADILEEQGGS